MTIPVRSPTEDLACAAGYNAYYQGVPVSRNPHPRGSNEFLSWTEGWLEAQSAEED